jgi:hypothetical protein
VGKGDSLRDFPLDFPCRLRDVPFEFPLSPGLEFYRALPCSRILQGCPLF